MADINKTIKDLDEQIAWIQDNDFHKFPGWGHAVLAMKDALELLKEQQPKKGRWVGINEYVYHLEQETGERYCVSAYYDGDLFCDQCWTEHRKTKYNFCPNCGADMRGEKE